MIDPGERHKSRSLGLLLALASCAHAPPPPHFADTPAFHQISGSVYGILERQLDGDELPDSVIAERSEYGYRAAVLTQRSSEQGASFTRACQGPLVEGESLDTFRWLRFGGRDLVLMAASNESPEELVQAFALVDVERGCEVRFAERVRLVAGDAGEIVAPPDLRGGMSAADEAITILDAPRYLRLAGAQGDVQVLMEIGERRIVAQGGGVAESARRLALMAPLAASVTPARGDEGWIFPPDAPGVVRVTASAPIVLLSLAQGCEGEAATPLEIGVAGSPPFVLGSRPTPDSFVRAAGLTRERDGVRRELVALRAPASEVELVVGPPSARRCLREIEAHGYAPRDRH